MRSRLPGASAPMQVCWDQLGIPHIFAASQEDAFRGLGYVSGYERLWQLHLGALFARGEAAAVLGERFVVQDAVQRAFDVPGERLGYPASAGDWVVDAYLEGLNGYVDQLTDVPPEFRHAGTEPRRFTRADVAARYRFTSWFQARGRAEKLLLGRLMATHGVAWWRRHVRGLSPEDESLLEELSEPLKALDLSILRLLHPELDATAFASLAGSNNWAIQGHLAAGGKPMLAMDPHQIHTIPNTFFYAHLSAPGWDTFGAGFPGTPYFMMGYTSRLAWGLTTGFVDNFDVYVERLVDGGRAWESPAGPQPLASDSFSLAVKGQASRTFTVQRTAHGPLLEPLAAELGLGGRPSGAYRTALHWELSRHATAPGALALLPMADSADAFGEALFEGDVCPLVNNIICVDGENELRRFVAATLPKRVGYTGVVPLAGWLGACDFEHSRAAELLVERNPRAGFSLTANNDTLGDATPYPIYNYPASPARAHRIRELLEVQGDGFTVNDFARMQRDLTDVEARDRIAALLPLLDAPDPDIRLARELLANWDCVADVDARGACVYYLLNDYHWPSTFMQRVLDDPVVSLLPKVAPTLANGCLPALLARDAPWAAHRALMKDVLCQAARDAVAELRERLGDDPDQWCFGKLHQVAFSHSLHKHDPWRSLQLGPDPIGGSATTLAMAMHKRTPPGEGALPALRVYHGPAYRLIVDLGASRRCRFVIASGNSGRPDSPHMLDHYNKWLNGDYFDVVLDRADLELEDSWELVP